jgi:uracil-DNA glycosylase family 4
MKELRARYKECTKCSRCLNSTKVYGCGNLTARIAVVGEGPGKDEVAELTPFVGKAGQLLDLILAGINLKRGDLFFTNAVLCRTDDKNRTPTKEEYSNCRKRLFEEINIVQPKFTLLVGNIALRSVMGSDDYQMSKCHGKWYTHLNEPCFFYYAIYHPSWILHSATEGEEKLRKKIMWEDIKTFRDDMTSLGEIYDNRGAEVNEAV